MGNKCPYIKTCGPEVREEYYNAFCLGGIWAVCEFYKRTQPKKTPSEWAKEQG